MYQKSRLNVRDKDILAIDSSPCGRYIVFSAENRIIKVDLNSQKIIMQSPELYSEIIYSIKYSFNGQLIASCGRDKIIIIQQASTLKQIGKNLSGHVKFIFSVAFSPDSLQLVSGSSDETIRIWDCQNQVQIGEGIQTGYEVYSTEYSPNGSQILSAGSYGNIDIWDSKTGQKLLKFDGHEPYVNTVTYCQDGRCVLSGGDDKCIKIWDAITGQQIGDDHIGHQDGITSLAFQPNSWLILSGSHDKTIRLWNFITQSEECILYRHAHFVNAVKFSRTGKQVLSGSTDQTISIVRIANE